MGKSSEWKARKEGRKEHSHGWRGKKAIEKARLVGELDKEKNEA